jgi:hypothetical protein
MKTKLCTKCSKRKPAKEFAKRKNTKDGLQYICRPCQSVAQKSNYKKTRNAVIAAVLDRKKKLTEEFKEWKQTLCCVKCGEDDPSCLDFHHIDPSKKDFQISKVIMSLHSDKLKQELQKCAVVCANCHRKIHAGVLSL